MEIRNRLDLSEWIVHFIHDKNPKNDNVYMDNKGNYFPLYPYTFENSTNSQKNLWRSYEEWFDADLNYPIEPDASAFQVLLKILNDAHIRSGWSIRNGKTTIFGLWPVVCFTEMPLYALLHYAKNKKDASCVNTYGICFRKQELFNAGARPVIYGLSTKHKENNNCEDNYYEPRILHESCGIGLKEQYRYVPTSMKGKFIDWTHEREWRWCDLNYRCCVPGLPLFGKEEPVNFSEILVLVNSIEESSIVLNKLKELFDAQGSDYDYEYSLDTLRNTYVVSLESLESVIDPHKIEVVKIENLPLGTLEQFQVIVPVPSFMKKVEQVLEKANQAAISTYKQYVIDNGDNQMPCGWAWVEVYDSQSELVQALIALNRVIVIGGLDGYRITELLAGIKLNRWKQKKLPQ